VVKQLDPDWRDANGRPQDPAPPRRDSPQSECWPQLPRGAARYRTGEPRKISSTRPVNGRRASLLGLVVAVMLLAAVASISLADPALAKKASSAPSTLTLKANFKRFGAGGVLGNDDRVFTFHRSTGMGVLVDGSTGRRTTVASRGCFLVDAIGGSSIAFSCGSGADVSYELYDMNSGQFRPLTVPSPIAGGCAPYTSACASLDAVGSYWAEFVGGCPTEHCGPSDVVFENFLTSATPADPSSRTVVPDLDARTLSRKLCKPVTVPTRTLPNSPPGFGSVVSDGRFQIATGDGGSYLEECGARLHRFLTFSAPASSPHAIVWESKPSHLTGVFLPSLKRFTIAVPANVDPSAPASKFDRQDVYSLALTTHTLYVGVGLGVLTTWTMPIPSAPPPALHLSLRRRR
jgi:hypothetical protein